MAEKIKTRRSLLSKQKRGPKRNRGTKKAKKGIKKVRMGGTPPQREVLGKDLIPGKLYTIVAFREVNGERFRNSSDTGYIRKTTVAEYVDTYENFCNSAAETEKKYCKTPEVLDLHEQPTRVFKKYIENREPIIFRVREYFYSPKVKNPDPKGKNRFYIQEPTTLFDFAKRAMSKEELADLDQSMVLPLLGAQP
tara:strand:+ start:12919 stop:13500 length:582 start_codon:yes stop_codon:yes gene_type:complete